MDSNKVSDEVHFCEHVNAPSDMFCRLCRQKIVEAKLKDVEAVAKKGEEYEEACRVATESMRVAETAVKEASKFHNKAKTEKDRKELEKYLEIMESFQNGAFRNRMYADKINAERVELEYRHAFLTAAHKEVCVTCAESVGTSATD